MCDRERRDSQSILNKPVRSTQIQPRTISKAIRGPGKGRVYESAIPRVQNHDSVILRIAPHAFKLGNDRTKSFRMSVFDRELRESEGTRREARQIQASNFFCFYRAVEGTTITELKAAVAAKFPGVPLPGIKPVSNRNQLGGKR